MTNNRIEEIRARWRRTDKPETLFTSHVQSDIDYLLSLLDARPAVAADVRELAQRIAEIHPPVDGHWVWERCPAWIESIAQMITDYANQRGEQAWREGVEAALTAMAEPYSDGDGLRNVDPRAITEVRTALPNHPADKVDG